MFAVNEDEILFDEILQSGLEAELQRLSCVARSTGLIDEDSLQRLDQYADDMWGAYTTPANLVRH
jgi:pyruvate-formate lyase-activating enzyme